MNAVIVLADYVPRLPSAEAAFAAIYKAVKRMGHPHARALEAGRQAKRDVLNGYGSTAWIVASHKQHLRLAAHGEQT